MRGGVVPCIRGNVETVLEKDVNQARKLAAVMQTEDGQGRQKVVGWLVCGVVELEGAAGQPCVVLGPGSAGWDTNS